MADLDRETERLMADALRDALDTFREDMDRAFRKLANGMQAALFEAKGGEERKG